MGKKRKRGNPQGNSQALVAAAERKRQKTLERAWNALEGFKANGVAISLTEFAEAANVSRAWLYMQKDLLQEIDRLDGAGKHPRCDRRVTYYSTPPASLRAWWVCDTFHESEALRVINNLEAEFFSLSFLLEISEQQQVEPPDTLARLQGGLAALANDLEAWLREKPDEPETKEYCQAVWSAFNTLQASGVEPDAKWAAQLAISL